MVISTLQSSAFGFPEAVDGAKAAAMVINQAGGLDGRQIQISSCNDQYDPNVAASCAQQAVSDKVDGVVSGYTSYGANIVPILEAANIAWIGITPSSNVELTSRVSFPVDPGPSGQLAAAAIEMYKMGCKKIALLQSSTAASALSVSIGKAAFLWAGGSVAYEATVPNTVADVTPYVTASINSGAGCIIPSIPPANYIKFLTAARQSSSPNILISNSGLTDALLAKLGSMTNGIINATSYYPLPTAPQVQEFINQMKAEGNAAPSNFALQAWAGVNIFAQAAKGLKDINNQTILDALGKVTVSLPTYPAPIKFSSPLPVKGWTRLFNTTYIPQTVKDLHFTALAGETINILPALQKAQGGS
ncbi:MAG: ABC transporter substrate-binding protein [Acidimicrobiales bacterium]|nr:ABC transporter substrate-binding protein [Acidimicrobiales bacterium]